MKSKNLISFSIRTFVAILCCLFVFVGVNFYTTSSHLYNINRLSSQVHSKLLYFYNQTIQASELFGGSLGSKTNVSITRSLIHILAKLDHSNDTKCINNSSRTTDLNNSTKGNNSSAISCVSNQTKSVPITTKKQHASGNRPDECEMCFRHDFHYIIDNASICDIENDSQAIDLVVMIFTVHKNRANRDAIRRSWISPAKRNSKHSNIRYAFLLGHISDGKLNSSVLEESKQYGDILKEDFIDTYQNLTYKTMMAFKWATTKCARAKFVMKTDDDMWVNVAAMLKMFGNQGDKLQTGVAGACAQKAGPIRDKGSKWYASLKSYPGTSYPGFCSGTGYVTSHHVAKKVFEISQKVPFFHLEDVYVSLCVRKLGYHLIGTKGFHSDHPKLDACFYKSDKIITSHGVSPARLIEVWDHTC